MKPDLTTAWAERAESMNQSSLLWTIRDSQRLVAINQANPTLVQIHEARAEFFMKVYEQRKKKAEKNARAQKRRRELRAAKKQAAEAAQGKGPLW